MITLSDQLFISLILPQDARLSNAILDGGDIIIESTGDYLIRVDEGSRFLGMEVMILSPSGIYPVNTFISSVNAGTITAAKYQFTSGLEDADLVIRPDLVVLQSKTQNLDSNGQGGEDLLLDDAMTTDKIQDNAVTTSKIPNNAVTFIKLSSEVQAFLDGALLGISAPSAWDGTSYAIDLSENIIYKRTIDDTTTTLTFALNFAAESATGSREIVVELDNSANSSAISSITFDDNSGTYTWK